MTYDPSRHHRRSIRLKGYDYSQPGLYFITINIKDRLHLLGEIDALDIMHPTAAGRMIEEEWLKLPQRFPNTALHAYIVMPDHFHAILEIIQTDITAEVATRATPTAVPTTNSTAKPTVGDILGAFESIVTVLYIRGVKTAGWPPFNGKLWQRNYYEHIIRTEQAYDNISSYIRTNPKRWNKKQ
jgi:REP element-mobilizing transposase RayT